MGKKILIVDDEAVVVKSIEKLLIKAGYRVGAAQSGEAAMAKIREEDFHLVICDVRMPQMNGIDAVKKIRAYLRENGKPPIPEILITGYASDENYDKAKELNIPDYIYKPFDIHELLTAVQVRLTQWARRREKPLEMTCS